MNILDFERTVNELKGLAAMSHFLCIATVSGDYLENRALDYLQDRLNDIADEVEKLFKAARELNEAVDHGDGQCNQPN